MTNRVHLALIESLVGQTNILSIPREVIRFFSEDIEVALFFSQLLLWHGRSGGGEIAKCYSDWQDEIGMKIHKVRRIVRELTEMGLIKTKLKKYAGRPVLHFTIHAEKFAEKLTDFITKGQNFDSATYNEVSSALDLKDLKPTDQLQLQEPLLVSKDILKRRMSFSTSLGLQNSDDGSFKLQSPDEKPSKNGKRRDIPSGQIIDILNRELGTAYRDSPTNQRYIDARWREGFRLPDFEKVIAKMSSRWKGDPEMEMYLRPQTLFGTKFESYLNAREGDRNGALPERVKRKTQPPNKYADLGDIIEV